MNHPLAAIAAVYRPKALVALVVATGLLILALNVFGAPLRTGVAPAGIISFEFAGDPETAQRIVDSWSPTARIWAGFNLGLDYLFMIVYSTTIALGIVWITQDRSSARRIGWLALVLAWGQWLAAGLDGVENAALMTSLVRPPVAPFPQIAWWSAALKFALVAAGILYVLARGVMWPSNRP
jgi:hypothetical protein